MNVFVMGCGGEGVRRDFPVIRINGRTDINFYESIPNTDFFTLQPGEFEVFDVDITATETGLYEIALGIEYTYQNTTSIKWLDETLYLYAPNEFMGWMPEQNDTLELYWIGRFKDGYYELDFPN